MKKISKKFIILIAFSVLVFALLYWYVDPQELVTVLKQVRKKYLFCAVLFFFLFRAFEALGLWFLLKRQKISSSFTNTLKYSFMGYFFSQLTPSGGGGQPAQLFFMVKDGISSGNALMALFPFNFVYHISLLLLGSFSYFYVGDVFNLYPLRYLFAYGILAQSLLIILVFLCIVKEDWLPGLVKKIFFLIKKIPILKGLSRKEEDLQKQMLDFKREARRLRGNFKSLLLLIPLQCLMLISSYLISYFIYRSLANPEYSIMEIVLLQCFISISSEAIPTPGAVGVTETSLYALFSQIVAENQAFVWMFLSRVFSLYLGLVIGLLVFCLEGNRLEQQKV